MKVRQGFVSNSSSSSFVCICSMKQYEDLKKAIMNPFERANFNLANFKKTKVLGQDAMVWIQYVNTEDFDEDQKILEEAQRMDGNLALEDEWGVKAYDGLQDLLKRAKKLGCFYREIY